ncbi:type-2 ice-structuring protein-like [Scomber japonicus]|uniref:type-2 ice-structuring protein-like n=1 Tax=Scomber japonicus TaxID=13676 RepID=UPI002304F413|nr:type-2 ice-structuring protein-like [Scomber japonicus]
MLTVVLVCAMMALVRADDVLPTNAPVIEVIPDSKSTLFQAKAGVQHEACVEPWVLYDHRCFFYDATPRTWAKAQQNCQVMGGSLASIHSTSQNTRLLHMAQGPTWIGGSDCQESDDWFWSDASRFSQKFWCGSQPDGGIQECCLQMKTGDDECWDDVSCKTENPSICSKNP